MPANLTEPAIEQSTYIIDASFTDEDGVAVIPEGLTWSLLTKAGVVVNERADVPIDSAATVSIVLHGDDLAIVPGESKSRVLLIQGVYDSTLGANLEIRDQASFSIVNLTGVT